MSLPHNLFISGADYKNSCNLKTIMDFRFKCEQQLNPSYFTLAARKDLKHDIDNIALILSFKSIFLQYVFLEIILQFISTTQ